LDSACGVHILGHRSKLHATHFMVVRHVLAYPGEAPTMVCLPFFFSLSSLEKHVVLAKIEKSMVFVNFINFDPYSFQF